jgi:hypothetical protein
MRVDDQVHKTQNHRGNQKSKLSRHANKIPGGNLTRTTEATADWTVHVVSLIL